MVPINANTQGLKLLPERMGETASLREVET